MSEIWASTFLTIDHFKCPFNVEATYNCGLYGNSVCTATVFPTLLLLFGNDFSFFDFLPLGAHITLIICKETSTRHF